MSGQAIQIGTPVHSKDGHHLGDVDQIVIRSDSRHIVYLIIGKGVFHEGRLVEPVVIDHANEKGVTLKLTKTEAEDQLVTYFEREFTQFRDVEAFTGGGFAEGAFPSNMSSGDQWILLGSGGGAGISQTGSFGLMPTPIIGDIVTESVTNLDENTTTITNGTDVLDSNGKKIGSVDELLLDDNQNITGFIVKAGFLFHHDLEIPIAWVDNIGHTHVRLSHTEHEAETMHR